MHCESIWYFFDEDELDDARGSIPQEQYWCLEAAMLLRHWIEKRSTIDQMSELTHLWCPSAAGGWRDIAVSLRNKLLETGMSLAEIRGIRLLCKHQAYYQIEHDHLKPLTRTIESNHYRGLAQAEESVLRSQTLQQGFSPISRDVEREPVEEMPAMSPTPSTQPAQRKRKRSQQQDQNAAQSTVITRAQSRKVANKRGKEVNFLRERTLRERTSNDSNNNNIHNKTTASKTTRRNNIGNTGVIGGKVDSRKSRRTGGTQKRGK